MTRIFVNLPVADLARSIAFYEALGWRPEPRFTDDTAACIVVSETIFVMLLTHAKFQGFAPAPIGDARERTQVLIALSCPSRAAVGAMVEAAVTAGGATCGPPRDHGFMVQHTFQDPDGHAFEPFWMDEAAIPAGGS
jgi:hypothetical protein